MLVRPYDYKENACVVKTSPSSEFFFLGNIPLTCSAPQHMNMVRHRMGCVPFAIQMKIYGISVEWKESLLTQNIMFFKRIEQGARWGNGACTWCCCCHPTPRARSPLNHFCITFYMFHASPFVMK